MFGANSAAMWLKNVTVGMFAMKPRSELGYYANGGVYQSVSGEVRAGPRKEFMRDT